MLETLASLFLILVPFLPLLAFVAISLVGAFLRPGKSPGLRLFSALIAVGAASLSALGSWFLLLVSLAKITVKVNYSWASFGGRVVEFSLQLDPLSAVVTALVGTIALAVTIYSLGYIKEEEPYARYFAYLSLFIGAMFLLVLSANLLFMYLAWEGVGLASYLLIGYYWGREDAGKAATKAFLVTRIGDSAFLLGIAGLFNQTGTFDIASILQSVSNGEISQGVLIILALLLLAGAAGKSAQVPLQVWLPDAMAGPTPVSALIHSATMVAAGVYLVGRMLPLFLAAGPVAGVVVAMGLASTLLASAAALAQSELKRLLAYSTISQLGEMMVGLGLGGLAAGTFHLVIQGLFKAALFLAAGNLIHALETGGKFEFARYAGTGQRMPITKGAFLVAGLALAGIPITFAPSSRDPILSLALEKQFPLALLLLVADFLTAAYITRAFILTFTSTGQKNRQATEDTTIGRLNENRVMIVPLLALVGLLIGVGLAGSPFLGEPFKHFIEGGSISTSALPLPSPAETSFALIAFLLSFSAALGGIGLTIWVLHFSQSRQTKTFFGNQKVLNLGRWAAGGFGFDQLYRKTFVAFTLGVARAANWFEEKILNPVSDKVITGVIGLARFLQRFDTYALDNQSNRLANFTLKLAGRQALFDNKVVDRATQEVALRVGWSSGPLSRLVNGKVENYLLGIFLWGLAAMVAAIALIFLA